MNITLTDGRKLKLWFQHFRTDDEAMPLEQFEKTLLTLDMVENRLKLKRGQIIGATLCWLAPAEQKAPEGDAHGISGQAWMDTNWDGEKARQASLSRALKTLFPKTDPNWKRNRTEVWLQYFNRFNTQRTTE